MTRREAISLRSKPPSDPEPPDRLGEHDGVVFQRERLAPIVRELLPLLREDYRENGICDERVPFNVDIDRYLDYDLVGVLQIVTARDRGLLIGYVMGYVNPHIDHSGVGWCMITWYWLYPEYRRAGIGTALLKSMLDFLKTAGVRVIEATEKIAHKHGMFERAGFKAIDTVYRKVLED